ncbi:MAG: SulP family inorganic anion transporter [Methylococcales bacterium]|nr:SulP family inorganic anion transporter [Methylococcales bacterium]
MNKYQSTQIPKSGLEGLKQNWKSDLQAGFMVFLIALPLCLGIAIGSGFPSSAGIITAIVGGLLVSRLNGSHIVINGPAAGLIVVMLSAVQSLGEGDAMAGYRYTLAAIMIAGFFQILMGVYKAGELSSFFPASVVQGMLTAMGIIIIAKQSHVMLGVTPEPGSLFSTISQIPYSLLNPSKEIAFIGITGLAILALWPLLKRMPLGKIPAPIVVILTGIGLGQFFGLQHEHIHFSDITEHNHLIAQNFLVEIPDNFADYFYLPDFSKILTFEFWGAVISICLVASLESLLSASAVEKLDPYKRPTDLDRDLSAVGVGNVISGFLGGLPMIAELVRSSANVTSGAKTEWSNFFHGLILLIFVVLFPHLIHSIPLASLAALLVYTGFRLASPKTFQHVLDVGTEQLFLFLITIIGVIATNLLVGVLIGVAVKLCIHLLRGVWLSNMFKIHFTIKQHNNTVTIKFLGSVLFSNFLPLKAALSKLDHGRNIVFDFSDGYLIDHTVLDFIHEFSVNYARQGGTCKQVGHPQETFSDHNLAARLMTEDDRKSRY